MTSSISLPVTLKYIFLYSSVNKVGDLSSSAGRSGSSWPPFQPLKPLGKYSGLSRILCSKTLHAILFFIFHKVSACVLLAMKIVFILSVVSRITRLIASHYAYFHRNTLL